ncbi:MAG: ComEC/Rec2 family competence protein [Rectinemataceae bacterium]
MKAFFDRLPVRFIPAWWFALGAAASFYPLFLDWRILWASSILFAIAVIALRVAGYRGFRYAQLAAFAFGAAFGLLLAAREAGQPPLGTEAVTAITRTKAEAEPSTRQRRLGIVGVEGRLVSDSRPARNGFRILDLEVGRLRLAGAGIGGSCESFAPGRGYGALRVLVRGGKPLASGSRVQVEGRVASPGLLVADSRDLAILDRGSEVAEFRSGLREAFLAAIGRVLEPAAPAAKPPASPRGTRRPPTLAAAPALADPRDQELADRRGLLLALLSGWTDGLSPADAAAFKNAGCAHVLALSGQHLALIAAGLVTVLGPLIGRRRALVPALVLVAAYTAVVGPGPSLLRALVAFALAALVTLGDRPQEGRALLGLCFVVHALIAPGSLREAGFALSYLAVAGLAVLSPRFEHALAPFCPPPLARPLAAALAAQAATASWIVLNFGVFQPAGILATVLTGPLVEFLMVFGLVGTLVVALVPAAASVTAPVEGFLLECLSGSMHFFAGLPSLALAETGPRCALALAVVIFAALIYGLSHVESRAFRNHASAPSRREAGL